MYLYGASGHGLVVLDIVRANGQNISAFIDDNEALSDFNSIKVLHDAQGLTPIIISIGNNPVRKQIAEKLKCTFAKAVHPAATISPSVKIDEGTVVMAGASINAGAQIGKHCIINTNASVDHECEIADFVHISPNAALCGNVHVGEGTHIGVGASVIPGVNIGRWVTVGAGATVISDIPDGATVVGTPAKIIKIQNI